MKPTLKLIMQSAFEEYEKTHPLPDYVRKAAWAIMNCRTEKMGDYVARCPEGHFEQIWYHSCRHRSCPGCCYMEIESWITKQKAAILKCPHYHIIFTIPDSLHQVWLLNVKLCNDTIIKCSKDSLMELLRDRKYMGATPGLKGSIQTWANDLLLHPHTHFIVTAGGLTEHGKWAQPKRKCLLPRKVLMKLFRGKMRFTLIKLAKSKKLDLPEGMSKQKFINHMNKLGRKRWNVKIKPPYTVVDKVVSYLGRYIRGGPISNSRFISFDGEKIRFKCRGTKVLPSREEVEVRIKNFIQRILLHIPIPRSQNIRSYGLYANSNNKKLTQSREVLGQRAPIKPEPVRWQDIIFKFTGKDPRQCPVCGTMLIRYPLHLLCHSPP
jgi:hypothetical protein